MITDRLDWTITNPRPSSWYAHNAKWDITFYARCKADLMSKINRFEREEA